MDIGATQRRDVTQLKLPAEGLRRLQGFPQAGTARPETPRPNAWVHHNGTGCAVRIRGFLDEDNATVELQGTSRARELAEHFLRDAANYEEPPENENWAAQFLEQGSYVDVGNFPQPPVWSLFSFHRYVARLVLYRPRRSAMRYIHPAGETRNMRVAKLLEKVFSDPAAARYASTRALQQAMAFCRRHPEISPTAVRIWEQAHRLSLPIDISCINEELGRCLLVKDVHGYTGLLQSMVAERIKPNAQTWALALSYTDDTATRASILAFIKTIGILDQPQSRAIIAGLIVKKDLGAYLDRDQGFREFLRDIETYLGPGRFNTRFLLRFLRVCRIRRPHIENVSKILAWASQAQGKELDKRCWVELMLIARKAGDLQTALQIIKANVASGDLDFHQLMLDTIFKLAWKKRYLNLSRTIWFYAATCGKITYDMQRLVSRSLMTNISRELDPDTQWWQTHAGKLIIGTDIASAQFDQMFPGLFGKGRCSVRKVLMQPTHGTLRHEQIQLGQLLIERDLNAWRFFRRLQAQRFLQLLDHAMSLDLAFKASKRLDLSNESLSASFLHIRLPRRPEPLKALSKNDLGNRRKWFVANGYKLDYDNLQEISYEDDKRTVVSADTADTYVDQEDLAHIFSDEVYEQEPIPPFDSRLASEQKEKSPEVRQSGPWEFDVQNTEVGSPVEWRGLAVERA